MPSGVEAPAVIPTQLALHEKSASSAEDSIQRVFWQLLKQSSYSFLVLELSLPPITIIWSEFFESSNASVCLFSVTLHIVSKKIAFVYTFFKKFLIFLNSFRFCVVWEQRIGVFFENLTKMGLQPPVFGVYYLLQIYTINTYY